ncbi:MULTISPECIES: hypothetical protein [unclassified Pseudonocardia]|uniref:hypothetical protein n=1 Tax=unclassified Pseudonocardia TaxID=2619320 RepID=UPI000A9565DE|nr:MULTISPECIES: hypothetical protein [unclassified Pseudonocardia]
MTSVRAPVVASRTATCPAVDAIAARIREELTGAPRPLDEGRDPSYLGGLWEALRVAAGARYTVTNSSRKGAAAAGWDVIDQWTGEVVDWKAGRRAADALATEQGVLNAAECAARVLTGIE